MTDQSDLPGVTTAGDTPVPDAASSSPEPAPESAPEPAPVPSSPPLVTGPIDLDAPAPAELVELAQAFGVATEFWDWRGAHVPVPTRTIVDVLAALDVLIETGDDVLVALEDAELRPWRLLLPDVVVIREGESAIVPVHVDADLVDAVEVWFRPEDGEQRRLAPRAQQPVSAVIDGRTVVQLAFELPGDLPLGWHSLRARYPATRSSAPGEPGYPAVDLSRPYVVVPVRLELPPEVARDRAWGFMTQLYSVRSRRSWGLGDLADLKEIVSWSAREHGAGFVLVNPLHAAEPIPPMEASPYLPTTRRFINPIYLRLEDIREVAYLPATERAIVEWQAEAMQALNTDPAELDRDAVWAAKCAALESIFVQPRSRERQASFEAFCAREGQGLADFAMWSVLAEKYGLPTENWPAHALDPRGDAIAHMHFELADRVQFHMWLQWCLDEQLASIAQTAKDAGMPIGVVHDLAVGVHPDGADAWALGDALAQDVTAGAPPDAFNQQGQDWSQPPWRPDRLVELGYAPYRDMLRTVLRHAGALRIDHIIGLFRFWWVPRGNSPADGTYVRYDHEALIGILALEAHRAGAFVIGEDLGTVEPWARDYLLERGILGTSILWFEKDSEGRPLPPERWRELCLATVTTHDLPPTAGYLAGEHVELRDRLGLLTRPLAEEWAVDEADRQAVLNQLTGLGLLGDSPTERDKVEALHIFLTRTPARLIGVALADAVGDRRTMNQPGTSREYPNWKLPLADGVGQPMLLEDAMDAIRVISLAGTVDTPLRAPRPEPALASVARPEPVESAGPVVAAEPVVVAEPAVEAEPVVVAEPAVEAGPAAEVESAAEPESGVEHDVPEVEPATVVQDGVATEDMVDAAPRSESEVEPEPDAEQVAEGAPIVEPEPEPEPELNAESVEDAEPGKDAHLVNDTQLVNEPEPVAESDLPPKADADAGAHVEPDVVPEQVSEPEPVPEPEQLSEPEPVPEPEPEPEPEPVSEPVSESEPEPEQAPKPASVVKDPETRPTPIIRLKPGVELAPPGTLPAMAAGGGENLDGTADSAPHGEQAEPEPAAAEVELADETSTSGETSVTDEAAPVGGAEPSDEAATSDQGAPAGEAAPADGTEPSDQPAPSGGAAPAKARPFVRKARPKSPGPKS